MTYIHHFKDQPHHYLQFRPSYPKELFQFLAKIVTHKNTAWDCATGTGQAAVELATFFKKVIASDILKEPLEYAPQQKNIEYRCMPAEKTTLLNSSIDLITIAQALHWFNLTDFYKEVRRVAAPHSIIAAWCYSPICNISPTINEIIAKLYNEILGEEYWPAERRYIDENYETIPFPFPKIKAPTFSIEKNISLQELLGYLETWSAVKEYNKRKNENPIDIIINDLQNAWGDSSHKKTVWSFPLLVGQIE